MVRVNCEDGDGGGSWVGEQCVLQGGRVLRRVLKRGSKKGLSRKHLEGRNTPFREYDPLRVRPTRGPDGQKGTFNNFQIICQSGDHVKNAPTSPRPATEPQDGPTRNFYEKYRNNTPRAEILEPQENAPQNTEKIPKMGISNLVLWGIFFGIFGVILGVQNCRPGGPVFFRDFS